MNEKPCDAYFAGHFDGEGCITSTLGHTMHETFAPSTIVLPMPNERDLRRFWSCIEEGPEPDCWNWKGSISKEGLATFFYQYKTVSARRFSYFLSTGTDPVGQYIRHPGKINGCCNPSHLALGTLSAVGGGLSIAASLGHTHFRTLKAYSERYGGVVKNRKLTAPKPHWKPRYDWRLRATEPLLSFLYAIQPYAIEKLEEINVAIEWLEYFAGAVSLRKSRRTIWTEEIFKRAKSTHDRLKAFKIHRD